MPATEKTWRNQRLLHAIFAASGLVLLLSTVWMFAADHEREWKRHQRKLRTVEERVTGWRLAQQQTEANRMAHQQLSAALVTAQSQAPDAPLLQQFEQLVQEDARRRGEAEYDFGPLQVLAESLTKWAAAAAEKRQAARQLQAKADKAQRAGNDEQADQAQLQARQADAAAIEVEVETARQRRELISKLSAIISAARFREDAGLTTRKFKAADYDVARANLDLAVRDNRPQEERDQLQAEVDLVKTDLDALTQTYQNASSHRVALQSILKQMTADEDALAKQLQDNRSEFERLTAALNQRQATYLTGRFPFLGKKLLELPIFDAFNSPLKIENLWTENLTIANGSFGSVRRFDRCTTCHQTIDETMPGSATEPAYLQASTLVLALPTPPQPPAAVGQQLPTLETVYGITLASQGLVDKYAVTVSHVAPQSLASKARVLSDEVAAGDDGLQVGDVLLQVNDDKVLSPEFARQFLLETVNWGQPLKITVQRGLPQPYSSHPRLDLFVGSLSPHKLSVMGCTICHEGQGSATAFKWASHTPNSPAQSHEWADQHGWFNNHHWIYPMYPNRFVESACLKCHHEVVELEPSDRFPEPPAPKLVQGYNLIRTYGCFGCHEINGYNGPLQRIGPDLRLEPNYSGAALQIKADPQFDQLAPEMQGLVRQLAQHPDRREVRHRLLQFLQDDAQAEQPRLSARSDEMAAVLQDVETPGTLRRVGPSLRYVSHKVGAEFLYDWIREPRHFRPDTRMPQFFGQWDHLDAPGKALAQRYEPVEILSLVTYLNQRSQPWQPAAAPEGIGESAVAEKVARGKQLFELRGCLACHKHQDFPKSQATFGPDLSNVADKVTAPGTPDARQWMTSWVRQPTHYSARSRMPDLQLDPIVAADGTTTDPAADITEYLLQSSDQWHPAAGTADRLQPDRGALDELVLEHLGKAYSQKVAQTYLQNGIPENLSDTLKGAEIELVGGVTEQKKLLYLGRKTITKYGCHGCHDIPGFEDAKPIGTAIADWGRKDPSKLAFEHIIEYIGHGHGHGHSGDTHGAVDDAHGPAHGDADLPTAATDFDESFYREKLNEHDRVGFLWQKLKEPRSYDFAKTANKDYNERLRMPRFPLDPEQREAVVTFVLGLVAEPPADEFVYQPNPRQHALVQGRKVLEEFNCMACHVLEAEKWALEFQAGDFSSPPSVKTYPFLTTNVSDERLQASEKPDLQRGVLHARITGMPAVQDKNGLPVVLDEEGDPIEDGQTYDPATLQHRFELWQPAVINGQVYEVGVLPLTVPATLIKKKYPPLGGDFTTMLLPRAVELERKINPNAKGTEAWGWLPPPLLDQGHKVRPEWLHGFLLDPYPIRPAVLLRMPKFNMSGDDAAKLVNYFAARDGAEYPYEFHDRLRSSNLAAAEQAYADTLGSVDASEQPRGETRLDHAMNIVTDGNYCIKCHIVADFDPQGSERAKAPDLSDVYRRLRPDYTRRWIASPKQMLPYTAMPVNIPYDPDAPHLGGVSQHLFHGTSIQQLDGLVDLLMNFDLYATRRSSVASLIAPEPSGEAAGSETEAGQ